MYAAHFSIKSADRDAFAAEWDGWTDRTREHSAPLATPHLNMWGTVSGSWACWGPHDQDTDGDDTLHVVVGCVGPELYYVPNAVWWDHTRSAVLDRCGLDACLGDYAVLTLADDWSQIVQVAFLDNATPVVRSVRP